MFYIKSIQTVDEFNQALERAKRDGHILVNPTHVVMQGQEIVGAITLLPTALTWMDTTKVKVRDSLKLIEQLSSFFAMQGQRVWCAPCTKTSPYFEFLPKDGFFTIGEYSLFLKGL